MYPPPPHLLSFLPSLEQKNLYLLVVSSKILTPSPDSNEDSLVKYTVKNDYKGVLSHFLDPVSFFITT